MAETTFEKTVAVISPNLLSKRQEIEAIIRASGLTVIRRKLVQLRKEQTERFFEAAGPFRTAMTSGPVQVLIICGFDAVARWSKLIGQPNNVGLSTETVYGSKDVVRAGKDVRFFFRDSRLEVDLSPGTVNEYLSQTVVPVLVKGLVELVKEKPHVPVLWLADWLLKNRPYEY